MTTTNPYIGSSFESWLDETGIREGVTAAAVQFVLYELRGDFPPPCGEGQGVGVAAATAMKKNRR